MLELPIKKDNFGLGFKDGKNVQVVVPRASGGEVSVVDDEVDNNYDMDNWIHPTVPG